MKRSVLERFMARYNLAREANAATWISDGDSLSVSVRSADRSMVAIISQQGVGLEAGTYHVYETTALSNMLSVLSEDFTVKVVRKNGEPRSLQCEDDSSRITFALADAGAIPESPKPNLAAYGNLGLELNLDKEFVDKFMKGKGAMADTDDFTVWCDGTDVSIIIGYDKNANTNRVTLAVSPIAIRDAFGPHSYSSKFFKEMLMVNKDAMCGSLTGYSKGIIKVEFQVAGASVVYYLPPVTKNG